jgi:hypothetical protein
MNTCNILQCIYLRLCNKKERSFQKQSGGNKKLLPIAIRASLLYFCLTLSY